ncbi:hypothetical protein HBI29_132800 [Parastagonospora nodorum]|nr:hypothetical protein HBH43_011320 [Parastagonospora nodorum]KAH5474444.1 hypothetical protein HBI28_110530 [Parastagonospora nodorum]KAH5505523.1 hypothetical protein HBI29_132800 [Parastagonospora nodorum]KAH5624258.1 hypothetical protein HBI22_165780 [Parastagonospora nodorum]KAH6301322.1 hypothetical protein HBI39_126460 [Parastagonospora nodorum]
MATPSKPIRACTTKQMNFEPSQMVTIRVGDSPEYKDFIAHESFLTSRSEFFRRAMNGSWTEAESRVVKLPEDEPAIFAIYLNLVYTGQLVTMRKNKEELASSERQVFIRQLIPEYRDIFRMYVLAEKLQDKGAKNGALAAAVSVSEVMDSANNSTVPAAEIANLVYKGTPEGSPGRRLVIDMYGMLPFRSLFSDVEGIPFHRDALNDLVEMLNKSYQKKDGYGGHWFAKDKNQKLYLEEEE